MQKKIVIRVQLDCDKCRSKALKVAAEAKGVSSVSLEGEERDQLVVTGEVDAVCLARALRKKFRCVTLLSLQDVKKEKEKDNLMNCYTPACPPPPCGPYPSYYVVYDPYPSRCFIM